MKKLFKFLGFKTKEKQLTEHEKETHGFRELGDKYNVILDFCSDSNTFKIIIRKSIWFGTSVNLGTYEKMCFKNGECLQVAKFFKQTKSTKRKQDEIISEVRVNSLEDAIKYFCKLYSEGLITEEDKKEIERINSLPIAEFN